MRLYLSFLVLIAVMGRPVTAAETGQGYGLGMHSCAEFARAYAANPTVTEDLYFTWAQGFMSGMNLMAIAMRLPFRNIDGNGMAIHKSRIRSYCDAHPLAPYAAAVSTVYESFPPMRGSSR